MSCLRFTLFSCFVLLATRSYATSANKIKNGNSLIKGKGDIGILNNDDVENKSVDNLRRGVRQTYRYYGAGNGKAPSSLLPTSPTKSHFYSQDAYGYPIKRIKTGKGSKGSQDSIQDYLHILDNIEELPTSSLADFGEMVAASSSYGGGGGHGGGHG